MAANNVSSLQWKLFLFGIVKIPLIGFCRPRVHEVSDTHISIKIPLKRRTRNHVKSMYLGVMSIGADLASGFLAYHLLLNKNLNAAPVFKTMKVEYLKRAESAVYFNCNEGAAISEMIDEMERTGERVNKVVTINAMCNDECVAIFEMELSMKLKQA
jgi:hypothetical protein